MTRKCGECTLCCRLVPVNDGVLVDGVRQPGAFVKPASQRCPHQRHTGCSIYHRRPRACQFWSCLWIANPAATKNLSRPDRSHYLIDMVDEKIGVTNNDTGEHRDVPAMQVWVDPRHPEAWRDPALLAMIEEMGDKGYMTILRYNSTDSLAVFPKSLTGRELKVVKANVPLR